MKGGGHFGIGVGARVDCRRTAGIGARSPIRWPGARNHVRSMRFEKMRKWQAAEQFVAEVDGIVELARFAAPNPSDHLERSAESALFNIAEGAGAYRPRVKIGCYEIAKKEVNEARAVLRRLVLKRTVTDVQIQRAYDLAGVLISMLTSAILTLEKRAATGR